MSDCPHKQIVIIAPDTGRKRCRHCHLTIRPEELGDGYCPECFETTGARRYDFEDVPADGGAARSYRCEQCGTILHPAG